jgi:[acyl-carrier-protein] S-malonyltransferase
LNVGLGRHISMNGIVAILCSGQGGQHAGMFDLFTDCAAVEPIFAAASDLLGKDPRRMVRAADPALFEDRIGQILCSTQALAAWAALGAARPARAVIAGYSVGELAAWGCAGAFDAKVVLQLALRRAVAMDTVAPKESGLAAIVGLRRLELEPILQRHAAWLAIINNTDSFVVGGHVDALITICQEAAALGAIRTVRLRVSVPSHTTLLARAVPLFRQALREAAPRVPASGYRLLSGIDGSSVQDPVTGCEKLARQIATTIDWAACITACRAAGAETALELGPGTALSHMAARVFSDRRARSTEDFRSLQGLQAWLLRAGN